MNIVKVALLVCLLCLFKYTNAQICATPGIDGPTNISTSINTYFPPLNNITLATGANSISLAAVPATDAYGNSFGTEPINAGDLLLIIQMQDATISFADNALYGANNNTSGPDALGGTGYTSLGNSGNYEYIIATSNVPLTGGTLTFKGAGAGNGSLYTYINTAPATTQGKKTFQVIRIPQYSNLRLSSNISAPPFNGSTGGIIAFEVAGNMDFNGFTIDASGRGFRGGYSLIKNPVANINSIYVSASTDARVSGKGEGIAGTPRYMWDGYNAVDNLIEGLPAGSGGKGAPANAGGGGNDTNSGGGGGGNGGDGGVGAWGYEPYNGNFPNGGRPGSASFVAVPITRLIMGGGGGGGHANDALTGVKGGVGGGIVLINAGSITGSGTVLANGGNGAPGSFGGHPDGSGGGGAGGTVFIKVTNPNAAAVLNIQAKGGAGGNTEGDDGVVVQSHGPGGGGGGGIILYDKASGITNVNVQAGLSGKTNSGAGNTHHAEDGKPGIIKPFSSASLPPGLNNQGSLCYPELTADMAITTPGVPKYAGDMVTYIIKLKNTSSGGSAGMVQADAMLPSGLVFQSANATYTGAANGSAAITNQGSGNRLLLGNFNIPAGDEVTITVVALVDCGASTGVFNSSVQALYLDPTRLYTDPNRKITAAINAFTGANTSYQAAPSGVPGTNFNGANTTNEDVIVASTAPATVSPNETICSGSSVGLTATGGTSYLWLPATGLSDANIANPIASPLVTTTYTVTASNGTCSTTATVTVTVVPKPVVNAGADQEMLKDNAIQLNGTATGTGNITYSWSPATYLSDANILAPIATPPEDITYTLTATSDQGCFVVSDDVFVKVYPKIIIPNTFTPNSDGVNDIWDINTLSTYPNCVVNIFSRYGGLVFKSIGYAKAWDGKYNGKILPFGTYYYTIDLKNGFKIMSGWVAVIK